MAEDLPLLKKIPKAAQRLSVSIRQIYVLAERGELEIVRDGRSAFVVAASEDAYVEPIAPKDAEGAPLEKGPRRGYAEDWQQSGWRSAAAFADIGQPIKTFSFAGPEHAADERGDC